MTEFCSRQAAWNAVLSGGKRFLLFPPVYVNASACDPATLVCRGDFAPMAAAERARLAPDLLVKGMRQG